MQSHQTIPTLCSDDQIWFGVCLQLFKLFLGFILYHWKQLIGVIHVGCMLIYLTYKMSYIHKTNTLPVWRCQSSFWEFSAVGNLSVTHHGSWMKEGKQNISCWHFHLLLCPVLVAQTKPIPVPMQEMHSHGTWSWSQKLRGRHAVKLTWIRNTYKIR